MSEEFNDFAPMKESEADLLPVNHAIITIEVFSKAPIQGPNCTMKPDQVMKLVAGIELGYLPGTIRCEFGPWPMWRAVEYMRKKGMDPLMVAGMYEFEKEFWRDADPHGL